ncbi:cytochrome P450 [Colletotrichum cereale]|nr:cytochrome P450 [Colletotrichum cereale]
MTVRQFHLLGAEADENVSLDLTGSEEVDDLRQDLAGMFSICDAKTITFHNAAGTEILGTTKAILEQDRDIGLKVSGKKVRSPYGPREIPFVGHHFEIYPDHLGNHDRLFERYGSVIKTVNMGNTIYLTNDPHVSEVVLSESPYFTKTSSDPNHPLYFLHDNRALFMCDSSSPAFGISHKFIPPSLAPRAVRRYTGDIQRCVEESFSVFDELDKRDKAFNVYQYMFKVAGQIIYRVVLGLDVGHFATVDTPPHEIIRLLGEFMHLMKRTSLQPPWYRHLPFGMHRRLVRVRERIFGLTEEAMGQAATTGDGGDLPMHEAALQASCIADYLRRATDERGEKLPQEYRLTNTVSMLGAGFVTSASLLSWLVYSLTHYDGCQERLLQELVDHGPAEATEGTATWDYDVITSMPFLDAFVKETHRMHNPSFQTARNTRTDVVVPGGWRLPAGAVVIPPFPSLHKNPAYWENPARFDPDRWLAGGSGDWGGKKSDPRGHRMAFTPFAAGPRGCIGYNLATLEAKLAIAHLVYRYEFVNASREPIEYDPEFLVIRPLNLYARARHRGTWPSKSVAEK